MKELDRETLRRLVRGVAHTRDREIGCDTCLEELDRFTEATLVGKSLDDALELVRDHLSRCVMCREEYEALVDALRAVE